VTRIPVYTAVKFSATSKDILYKNLKVQISELLTTLPKLDTKQGEKFKQQVLDLQQEYKGNLLSVHHPKDASDVKTEDLHDDYPDSWALAEWAYAKWYASSNAAIAVVSAKPERKVKKMKQVKSLITGQVGTFNYDAKLPLIGKLKRQVCHRVQTPAATNVAICSHQT
jgi:hypothetical protein